MIDGKVCFEDWMLKLKCLGFGGNRITRYCKGFVRIRHYGICSSSSKIKSAGIIKAQLPPSAAQLFAALTKAAPEFYNPSQCPCCKKDTMEMLTRFNRRGSQANWKERAVILLNGMKAWNVKGSKQKKSFQG